MCCINLYEGTLRMYVCEHCGKPHPQHFVVKHYGRCSEQLPFCNKDCEIAYYLNQLKKEMR